MKNTFLYLLLIPVLFITPPPAVFAQTAVSPSPTVRPTNTSLPTQKVTEKLSDEINELKDRIASRVAQLNLVEKRGVIGVVKSAAGTKITITDLSGTDRFLDVDEITKFTSGSSKDENFGISDLSAGTSIRVLGNYNKQSKRILARYVDVVALPKFLNGVVSGIDKTDFTITVVGINNTSVIVDIENTTRTSTYTEASDVVKAGFSKIAQGQRVHIVGYPSKTEQNRISATRILVFPEIKTNPSINTANVPTQVPVTLSPTSNTLRNATPTP